VKPALLLLAATLCAQAPDVWAPMRRFIGAWDGETNGQPGKGTSIREYRFVLGGKYIEVRNKSVYPPQAASPKGETHEDWGMISFDKARKKFVLRQFHVEGFVNQYAGGEDLRFESEAIENIPPGYRARETYVFDGDDAFIERFELAAPGKAFVVYTEARFRRR